MKRADSHRPRRQRRHRVRVLFPQLLSGSGGSALQQAGGAVEPGAQSSGLKSEAFRGCGLPERTWDEQPCAASRLNPGPFSTLTGGLGGSGSSQRQPAGGGQASRAAGRRLRDAGEALQVPAPAAPHRTRRSDNKQFRFRRRPVASAPCLRGYRPLRGVWSGTVKVLFQALEVLPLGGNGDGRGATHGIQTVIRQNMTESEDEEGRRRGEEGHEQQAGGALPV